GHEGAAVPGQVDAGRGDVVGPAERRHGQPGQHGVDVDVAVLVWIAPGPDGAGRHGVGGHPVGAGLPGDGRGQPLHPRLGGDVVGPLVDVPGPPVVAADVDDPAPAPLPHPGQHEVRQVEAGVEVDGQAGVPVVDGDVLERLAPAYADVGHRDVDRPEGVGGLPDQPLDVAG